MDKYEFLYVVGEGTYGRVIKALNKETGQIVAVKKFKDPEDNLTVKRIALREIRILKMLKHLNIVTLLDVFQVNKKICLVFEYVESTLLKELDRLNAGIQLVSAKRLIFQLLQALKYFHSKNIIHRDIKPENLLISSTGVLKLCDFGFARKYKSGQKLTEYVSTRWYRAPELLIGGKNYNNSVDVWAVGCVFYEMLTGSPLFAGTNDIDTLCKIIKSRGDLTDDQSQVLSNNQDYYGIKVCLNQ